MQTFNPNKIKYIFYKNIIFWAHISSSCSFHESPSFFSLAVRCQHVKSNLKLFTPHILIWRTSQETRLQRCLSPSLPASWNHVEKHLCVFALIWCVYRGVSFKISHVVRCLDSCLLVETVLSRGFNTRQCLDFITGRFCSSEAAERRKTVHVPKKFKLTNLLLVKRRHKRDSSEFLKWCLQQG